MMKMNPSSNQVSCHGKPDLYDVAVLGHTGFIGGAIYRHLMEEGFKVHAASSRECNLLDAAQVGRFLTNMPEGVCIVFCAAINRTVEDSYNALLRNIQMMHNFVSSAQPGRISRVVYLSSVDVYGRKPELPVTERTLPAPASFYGISKLTSEFLLRTADTLGCPVTVLRLPGIYGSGDGERSVVGRFLSQMLSNGRVTIYGDGSVKRDFVEVGDVCKIVKRILERPFDGVLNVATGKSLSIREVVATLACAADMSPTIDYAPQDTKSAGDLTFDVKALGVHLPAIRLKSLQQGSTEYINKEEIVYKKLISRKIGGKA